MAALLAVALPSAPRAQDAGDAPLLRFGLTTGLTYNSNRGLETSSSGSTTELTTRLDVLMRFATPIQDLEFSGDVGLRSVSGEQSNELTSGLFNPNVKLDYARRSRDAELTVGLFLSETDVSASELQFDAATADLTLLEDIGTQRRFGFDTTLELRRRSPFGVTFSAGYTGLRYSDTNDPDLTDQDRFRAGVRLRFDLNPSLQALASLRVSTFEDFGTPDGRRDTYTLDASLRQDVRNGNILFSANATDTEDGTRYGLRAGRTFETEIWEVSGTLGLSRGVSGDLETVGSFDLRRDLPNGALTAALRQSLVSNTDDDEQRVTTVQLGYSTQLTALTSFRSTLSYTDRSDTAAGAGGSFGTFGVSVAHSFTDDWSVNVGLQHRFLEEASGARARDNQLSISLRRVFEVRR